MSSLKNNRLPLVCHWTRLRASLTGHQTTAVHNHCATCADCRHYFDTVHRLENSLRREAVAAGAIAPGTLESRILNAVKHSQREESRPRRPLSWGMAGLAAAAVAAVLIMRIPDRPPPETPGEMASLQDVIVVANELPKQWLANLQPGAVKLLEDNPLQTEMASVNSDARSALSFLAMNFLPSSGDLPTDTQPVSPPRRSS